MPTVKRMALEKLRQHILDEKPLVRFQYVEELEGETCYCAVGHIMNSCGIDLARMKKDADLNGSGVISSQVSPFVERLVGYGFTVSELSRLQNANDESDYDGIIGYIERILVAI